MRKNQTIRIFKKFLKKHDAYNDYCEEMHKTYGDIFTKLMKNYAPYNFVSGHFAWNRTSMDEDYWSDLNDDWIMFLERNYHPK